MILNEKITMMGFLAKRPNNKKIIGML